LLAMALALGAFSGAMRTGGVLAGLLGRVGAAPAGVGKAPPAWGAAIGSGMAALRPLMASAPARRNAVENEIYDRTRQEMVLGRFYPNVATDAFVAPNAQCIGNVDVHMGANVWYGCVLRGDEAAVVIGPYASIGDKTVVCSASSTATGVLPRTFVGMFARVGPLCVIKAATLENECVVGARSFIGEGSVVERHAVVGPGSVVPPGSIVPSGQVWQGNPIAYVRDVTKDEKEEFRHAAQDASGEAMRQHASEVLPFGTQYLEAEKLRDKLGLKQPTFEIFAPTPEFELPPPIKPPPATL